jgi:hypothetical protein
MLFQDKIYPSKELSVAFVPNDILNLCIGTPIIIISMILTKKGKLVGLLCYPGALLYITYIYIIYLLGLPFNLLFIPYLILVTVSIYTIIGLMASIDSEQVSLRLKGYVPIRTAGAILFAIASLTIIYQIFSIANAFINQSKVDQIMIAQWIDDLVIASPPVMIIGYSMMRRKALGYTSGTSLLLLLSVLFIGVIPILVVKGVFTNTSIDVIGIIIVLASGMITFIPFILFIRGINKALMMTTGPLTNNKPH